MSKAARNPWSKRPTALELRAIQIIWHRFARDDRDLLEGGIAPAVIAREADTTTGTASELCLRLASEGTLVELHGVDPEHYRPRRSFAPAALVEDEEGASW